MRGVPFGGSRKVTIYKTHDMLERDLFAKKLAQAGIWHQTRSSEMARNTASFGSNFVDVQRFAGDRTADNRFYCIDVRARDEAWAQDLLGPRCRVMETGLI
mgnify:FL=1